MIWSKEEKNIRSQYKFSSSFLFLFLLERDFLFLSFFLSFFFLSSSSSNGM